MKKVCVMSGAGLRSTLRSTFVTFNPLSPKSYPAGRFRQCGVYLHLLRPPMQHPGFLDQKPAFIKFWKNFQKPISYLLGIVTPAV